MDKMSVIVPLAGYGRRFREAGYMEEKPLIQIGGKTLLSWSLSCVPPASYGRLVMVCREDQDHEAFCAFARAETGGKGHHPIVLSGPTQGAACSVLAAAVGLPPDDPVLVMNCDQWFKVGTLPAICKSHKNCKAWSSGGELHGLTEAEGLQSVCNFALRHFWDGFILTFPGTGPAWSYAVTNGTDRVVWVVEKKPVSEHAAVGVYWWRRAGDLVRSICAMVASGQRTNDEYYLAPAYNFLPLADYDVRVVPVEEFRGLGTPEQVRGFAAAVDGGWRPNGLIERDCDKIGGTSSEDDDP